MKTLWKGFLESPTHVLLPVGLSLSERCYNCSQKILHIKGTARLLLGELLYSPCYKQSQAPLKSGLPYLCKSLDFQNPLKALNYSMCWLNYQINCWNQGLLRADNWKWPLQICHIFIMFLTNTSQLFSPTELGNKGTSPSRRVLMTRISWRAIVDKNILWSKLFKECWGLSHPSSLQVLQPRRWKIDQQYAQRLIHWE